MIPEPTKDDKLKKLSENEVTLKQYLLNYSATFSRDLDEMWVEHDKDKNGYLDKSEARTFVAEVKKVISEERGKCYDEASFD